MATKISLDVTKCPPGGVQNCLLVMNHCCKWTQLNMIKYGNTEGPSRWAARCAHSQGWASPRKKRGIRWSQSSLLYPQSRERATNTQEITQLGRGLASFPNDVWLQVLVALLVHYVETFLPKCFWMYPIAALTLSMDHTLKNTELKMFGKLVLKNTLIHYLVFRHNSEGC